MSEMGKWGREQAADSLRLYGGKKLTPSEGQRNRSSVTIPAMHHRNKNNCIKAVSKSEIKDKPPSFVTDFFHR